MERDAVAPDVAAQQRPRKGDAWFEISEIGPEDGDDHTWPASKLARFTLISVFVTIANADSNLCFIDAVEVMAPCAPRLLAR